MKELCRVAVLSVGAWVIVANPELPLALFVLFVLFVATCIWVLFEFVW